MATSHLSAHFVSELKVAGRILRAMSIDLAAVLIHLRTGLDGMPNIFWWKCHALIFGETEAKITAEAWMPWLLDLRFRGV